MGGPRLQFRALHLAVVLNSRRSSWRSIRMRKFVMDPLAQRRRANVLAVVAVLTVTAKACVPSWRPAWVALADDSLLFAELHQARTNSGGCRFSRKAQNYIQWGTYPKLPAEKYIVGVYIGEKKVDGKNQSYAPHGSLPAKVRDKRWPFRSDLLQTSQSNSPAPRMMPTAALFKSSSSSAGWCDHARGDVDRGENRFGNPVCCQTHLS